MHRRVELKQQFIVRAENFGMDFLNPIVTGDETWMNTYDPETKQESSMSKTPGSQSQKKFKVSRSGTKRMFIVFLAHLSRRLMGELIVYQSLRHPSSVRQLGSNPGASRRIREVSHVLLNKYEFSIDNLLL